MTMHIGSISGGRAWSEFEGRLQQIKQQVIVAREVSETSDTGSIDLVFDIPGDVWRPDYTGLRTGRFSRKQKILQIQVAVPREDLAADEAEEFIFDSMTAAIEMAAAVFEKAKIAFDKASLVAITDSVSNMKRPRPQAPPPDVELERILSEFNRRPAKKKKK
jgi:hypothetical protein